MNLAEMDPIDIKFGLQKRFGTIAAFERVAGLPPKSVNDVMRKKSRPDVAAAIVEALSKPIPPRESEYSDDITGKAVAHRQNAVAR